MSTFAALLTAGLLGATISIYQPMNGLVSRITGSPLAANTLFYLVAFLSSAAMMTVWTLVRPGVPGLTSRLFGLPPVLLLAGTMSSVMVLGTIVLLPRLGARRLFLLQVAGQVIMALAVAHFGILGTSRDPLTLRKALGALLLLAGAVVSVL
jgi:transporter family-2 protein